MMDRDHEKQQTPDHAPEDCDLNFHGQCIVDNQECGRSPGQNSRDCFNERVKRRDSIHSGLTPAPDPPQKDASPPAPKERHSLRKEINTRRAMLGLPPIQ